MSAMAGEEFGLKSHSLIACPISETTHAIPRSHVPFQVSEDRTGCGLDNLPLA